MFPYRKWLMNNVYDLRCPYISSQLNIYETFYTNVLDGHHRNPNDEIYFGRVHEIWSINAKEHLCCFNSS